ncbi:MAG: PA2779 family protein [Alcanivoracaceae bacterium]
MNMRFVLTCLLSLTLVTVAPMAAYADMLSTSMVLVEAERNSRIELVERYMDREDVRSQMEAMGVDSALATERVAGLSDRQLEQLALNIETSPAGSGELGIIIAVLVILLLLEILGVTNIFKKV